MEFITHSHRHAYEIFTVDEEIRDLWNEIVDTLKNISDEDIINEFNSERRQAKSISEAINKLIAYRLSKIGWEEQSRIFADPEYSDNKGTWRLDFAKDDIAVEVAFNHGGNASWNLIKPVLSSELNHVQKAIQTKVGVVITATDEMKRAGGFDGAVGSYEKYVEYCKPLNDILTTPIMIVGLLPPKTFEIKQRNENGKKVGYIERI
ncbi:MAG: hypothetical protein IJG97_06520 [Bacilli bacterium]|nr:hypothetical protein [Bacilli bacterium]